METDKEPTERVEIRGALYSVHRFNPNIIATSVVIVQSKAKPYDTFTVKRIVTYKDAGEKNLFHTSVNGEKIIRGSYYGSTYGEERKSTSTLEEAIKNHTKLKEFEVKRVVNPQYEAFLLKDYCLAENWDSAAADKYFLENIPSTFQKNLAKSYKEELKKQQEILKSSSNGH